MGPVPRATALAERLRLRIVLQAAAWLVVVWVVVFWGLGEPSFWDPGDEAHYAQASREMLASGDWLAPMYNGEPFFDKPILFYLLQILAFKWFGPNEFAARIVPAASAVALFVTTWWLGRRFFSPQTGTLGALMVALLPATFALSSYAILDMTFTALLFAGVAIIAVSALRDRPRLQYAGYALVALGVLTKGPLALALTGLTFAIALIVAPDARRPLLRLRWVLGLLGIVLVCAPWFLYMWWRFRGAFVDGYLLRENLWLFTRGLSGPRGPELSYLRVVTVGLLPWTPLLAGRVIDIARGDRCSTEERLLWTWSGVVIAFFMLSSFRLDHYVYPAAPALCLLGAEAWCQLRRASSLRPHLGVAIGVLTAAATLAAAGVALIPLVGAMPMELPTAVRFVPAALIAAGAVLMMRLAMGRLRPPPIPLGVVGALLVTYFVVTASILPQFERAKPVKALGRWVAEQSPASAHIAAYRMDRWNTSWRFYVGRHVTTLDSPDQFRAFQERSGRHYCLMLERDAERLAEAGYRMQIERRAEGLFTTTGRALRRQGRANWQTFVIVTDPIDREQGDREPGDREQGDGGVFHRVRTSGDRGR